MGATGQRTRRKVTGGTVIAAIAMLVGIVALAIGYSQDSRLFLYGGLIITLAGVLTGLVFSVLLRHPEDSDGVVR